MKQAIRAMRLDFLTVQQQLAFKNLAMFFVFVIVFIFVDVGTTINYPAAGISLMYGMVFASYPFAVGEKTQMDLLYASLPLRRRDLVRGRYLYALCVQVLVAVLTLLLVVIVGALIQADYSIPEKLGEIRAYFFAFSTITMMQMPIYFMVGYAEARFLALIPILAVFAAVLLLGQISMRSGFDSALVSFASMIAQNMLLTALVALAFYFLLYKISFALSLRFYEKRDL